MAWCVYVRLQAYCCRDSATSTHEMVEGGSFLCCLFLSSHQQGYRGHISPAHIGLGITIRSEAASINFLFSCIHQHSESCLSMQFMALRMGCHSQSPELGVSLHRVLLKSCGNELDKWPLHRGSGKGKGMKMAIAYGERGKREGEHHTPCPSLP